MSVCTKFQGVATIVQGTVVQGDSCPRDFYPMTKLSKKAICPRTLLAFKSLSSKALISFKGVGCHMTAAPRRPAPPLIRTGFDQPARLRERCTNVLVPGDFTWCLVWHNLQISSLCYISFFKDYRVWPIQVNSLVEAKFRSHFAFLLNDIIEQDK